MQSQNAPKAQKTAFLVKKGSLAQLVQSICLTSRGSGVRIPQLPRKKRSSPTSETTFSIYSNFDWDSNEGQAGSNTSAGECVCKSTEGSVRDRAYPLIPQLPRKKRSSPTSETTFFIYSNFEWDSNEEQAGSNTSAGECVCKSTDGCAHDRAYPLIPQLPRKKGRRQLRRRPFLFTLIEWDSNEGQPGSNTSAGECDCKSTDGCAHDRAYPLIPQLHELIPIPHSKSQIETNGRRSPHFENLKSLPVREGGLNRLFPPHA